MAGLDSELTRDDGLILPVVGVWALKKHKVFGYYSQIFATSMKKKWECRVYLDLFAGAGKARVRGTKKIIAGSPLLSLNAEDPFDRYIFCDKDSQNIDALTRRVGNYFPERNRTFVRGDSNNCVDEILKAIPRYSKGYRVLTLCLVDPYKASDICFETIRGIAQRIIADFLILIPSYMDINRNRGNYIKPTCPYMDTYLGTDQWRENWQRQMSRKADFGLFIANEFCSRMKSLGYLYEGASDLLLVRMCVHKSPPSFDRSSATEPAFRREPTMSSSKKAAGRLLEGKVWDQIPLSP
jgi:three-Cys-motif partner protein